MLLPRSVDGMRFIPLLKFKSELTATEARFDSAVFAPLPPPDSKSIKLPSPDIIERWSEFEESANNFGSPVTVDGSAIPSN